MLFMGRRGRVVAAGIVAPLVGATIPWFVLQLFLPYARFMADGEKRLMSLQQDVQDGLIAEAQLPNFQSESALVESQVEAADRTLPFALGPRPVDRLRARARALGLDAEVDSVAEERLVEKSVLATELALEVCAPSEEVEGLLVLLCATDPLHVVRDVERTGGCTRARVWDFRRLWTEDSRRWAARDCDGRPEAPRWLCWPFSERAASLEQKLGDACAELNRLEAVVSRVKVYEQRKAGLERRRLVIDAIRQRRVGGWCPDE